MNRLIRRIRRAHLTFLTSTTAPYDPALILLVIVAFFMIGIHGGLVALAIQSDNGVAYVWVWAIIALLCALLALAMAWRRLQATYLAYPLETPPDSRPDHFQAIVNVLPTGILVIDQEIRVVMANEALRTLLGSSFVPGMLRPEPYTMINSQSRVELLPHERPLTQALRSGQPVSQDNIIVQHPSLGEINVLVQAVPIVNSRGEVIRAAATFQDITELHKLEQALQSSLSETRLLYEISHTISRTSTVPALVYNALWQMNALSPDRALVLLKDDSGEITLAGSSPPFPEPETEAHDWQPFLREDRCVFHRENAEGAPADFMDHLGLTSITSFPMAVREGTIGWLLVGYCAPTEIPADQNRLMLTLADQAAITLENQRLLLNTERALQHTAMLYRASRSIADTHEPSEMLLAFARLTPASQMRFAALYLLQSDPASATSINFRLAATWGQTSKLDEIGTHYSTDQFPFWAEISAGRIVYAGDVATDETLSPQAHAALNTLGADAATIIPLTAAERTVGIIIIGLNPQDPPNKNDLQIYQSLADQAAASLENARLFSLYQRRAAEMAFLFQVTTAATTSPNLDESLKQAVATLRQMMGVANASIYLPDDSGRYLIREADPNAAQSAAESSGNLDRSLVGWVARRRQAVMINNLADDPRKLPDSLSAQSAIAVPMRTAGDLIGILVVESDQSNAFTEDDLRLLQALSGSLAAILQNSRLLREMKQANERLLEVGRLKTNFLAAMSHELRTPLNSIIGFSRVILKGIDGPLTEAQEQDLTAIFDSGKHLLGLVNDILDQAKIEAGKMDVSFAFFKMSDIIKGVMSSAIGLTRDKPIHLSTEVVEGLPAAYGDEFRTRQVLLNLISNAAKFTNEGKITVSAYPVTEHAMLYIRVDVADTGIGIAEKDMPLLFEAFQQIDNSLTRSVEGTGMGLPLAKSLIELQHGRIEVQSEVGVGSTFSILIPTQPPSEDPTAADLGNGQAEEHGAAPKKALSSLLAGASTSETPQDNAPRVEGDGSAPLYRVGL